MRLHRGINRLVVVLGILWLTAAGAVLHLTAPLDLYVVWVDIFDVVACQKRLEPRGIQPRISDLESLCSELQPVLNINGLTHYGLILVCPVATLLIILHGVVASARWVYRGFKPKSAQIASK
jgi:hypothetical protein